MWFELYLSEAPSGLRPGKSDSLIYKERLMCVLVLLANKIVF